MSREDYERPNRRTKYSAARVCPFCHLPRDFYHDDAKCSADYQKRCDEEARLAKEGRHVPR